MNTAKKTRQVLQQEAEVLSKSIGFHFPVVWDRASGATVWDIEGKEYVDLTCGICVTNLGHCHPRVMAAMSGQMEKLAFAYEFAHPARAAYAEALVKTLGFDEGRVLFKSSGGEAVDTALLLAQRVTGKAEFVSYTGSFHGGTFGALAVTGEERYRNGFILGERVHFAPYPYCYRCPADRVYPGCGLACVRAFEELIRNVGGRVAAVIAEPMQGSAGVIVPPAEYWRRVADILREREVLLIFDEIQTGFGRTGTMYGFEHYGMQPDIVLLSKGMANGFPMSAVVARDGLLARWGEDDHSSTFGGNPLGCAAGAAVLDALREEKLVGRAETLGRRIGRSLGELAGLPMVGDIRGRGLFWGIEFVSDKASKTPAPEAAAAIRRKLWEQGVLTVNGGLHRSMVRILPPLTIGEELLDAALDKVAAAVEGYAGSSL